MAKNSGELGVDVDLLGDPFEPLKDPRGRPSFAKTKQNQLVVATFAASGWTHAAIATYLQCDEKTLRKHFSRELSDGAIMIEGLARQALVKKMLAGHVGATNRVLEFAQAVPKRSAKAKDAAESKPGKKEMLRKEAGEPTPGWADALADLPN